MDQLDLQHRQGFHHLEIFPEPLSVSRGFGGLIWKEKLVTECCIHSSPQSFTSQQILFYAARHSTYRGCRTRPPTTNARNGDFLGEHPLKKIVPIDTNFDV
jgi:hypothetical protein